jgi:long-chain acyl-CoA synthetase
MSSTDGHDPGWTTQRLLKRNATEYPDMPALTTGIGADAETITWGQLRADVAAMSHGLEAAGLRAGDRMLIMMASRPEHWVADLAAAHLGAIPSTVYATLSTEQIGFVARHSAATVVVLEGEEQLSRWAPVLDDLPELRTVVLVDTPPDGDSRFRSYRDLLASGAAQHPTRPAVFEERVEAAHQDDPVTVIYTSGTTGEPKGVVLSHRNVFHQATASEATQPSQKHPRTIAYLPLAHVAERVLSIYMPLYTAGHVTICPDSATLPATLQAVRPHGFFGVPRVWEKLATALRAKLDALPPEQREVVDAARDVAFRAYEIRARGGELPEDLAAEFEQAQRTVLRPMQAALGLDQAARLGSGAAPIPAQVLEFFGSMGLTIIEVWGLSETTGSATTNRPDSYRPGRVGLPAHDMEVRLAEDNEVEVRGPLVFQGYLEPDGTISPATDADGWFPTGDIGELDADGFLTITDRKKELIVTSGGKNVAPTKVEGVLRDHPLIGYAAVIGDRRPYLTALLTLDEDGAPAWARARGIEHADLAALAADPKVRAEIDAAVERANGALARPEQLKDYRIVGRSWTPESGEVTPKLSLKRRVISERYDAEIEQMYAREGATR